MPQSGKVIKPGVSNPRLRGIKGCALKGRREAHSNAAERQSDKAWGFKPQVKRNKGLRPEGARGRLVNELPCAPSGRKH
ncbi:MAG: hypothetical protein GY795_22920 [Desulfobacterales bacterium]|nr:hypothetical protein [Desulfobacterales bacterium]